MKNLDNSQMMSSHLGRQSVIEQRIRPMFVGAKRPDRSRREEIPFVFFFEKFAALLYSHSHIDSPSLDVFGNATFEWLSYHGKPIPVQKSAESSTDDPPPTFCSECQRST